jgi:hypothetical protein
MGILFVALQQIQFNDSLGKGKAPLTWLLLSSDPSQKTVFMWASAQIYSRNIPKT